jgi:hypothetical protein
MIALTELTEVLRRATAKYGPFTLFGLFMREEAPDKWDLVVSSPWLEAGKLKALSDFAVILRDVLTDTGMLALSRVVTLNSGDPALDAILRSVQLEEGPIEMANSAFFGLPIKHAFLFRAVRPKSDAPPAPVSG